jgi:hypothetical protein
MSAEKNVSWLDVMMAEMVKNLPKDGFVDRSGGLKDVRRVIDIVEEALKRREAEVSDAGRASALKAAADPFHNFIQNPVFAPMGVELWKAMDTFPRILRNAMLIATYSHVEYLLLSWCESPAAMGEFPELRDFPRGRRESYPHHYLRYLRDGVGMPLGDFTQWPEWGPLNTYRVARNCLAHNGGIVRNAADHAAIGALPGIEIDETGLAVHEPVVHLLPGSCEAAADTMMAFIETALTAAGL